MPDQEFDSAGYPHKVKASPKSPASELAASLTPAPQLPTPCCPKCGSHDLGFWPYVGQIACNKCSAVVGKSHRPYPGLGMFPLSDFAQFFPTLSPRAPTSPIPNTPHVCISVTRERMRQLLDIAANAFNCQKCEALPVFICIDCERLSCEKHAPTLSPPQPAPQPENSAWILCSERLPEPPISGGKRKWYWITDGELYDVAIIVHGKFSGYRDLEAMHWSEIEPAAPPSQETPHK